MMFAEDVKKSIVLLKRIGNYKKIYFNYYLIIYTIEQKCSFNPSRFLLMYFFALIYRVPARCQLCTSIKLHINTIRFSKPMLVLHIPIIFLIKRKSLPNYSVKLRITPL